ncbi:hypothetical protein ACUH89_03250 [Dermabacteraceae bacterium P13264]
MKAKKNNHINRAEASYIHRTLPLALIAILSIFLISFSDAYINTIIAKNFAASTLIPNLYTTAKTVLTGINYIFVATAIMPIFIAIAFASKDPKDNDIGDLADGVTGLINGLIVLMWCIATCKTILLFDGGTEDSSPFPQLAEIAPILTEATLITFGLDLLEKHLVGKFSSDPSIISSQLRSYQRRLNSIKAEIKFNEGTGIRGGSVRLIILLAGLTMPFISIYGLPLALGAALPGLFSDIPSAIPNQMAEMIISLKSFIQESPLYAIYGPFGLVFLFFFLKHMLCFLAVRIAGPSTLGGVRPHPPYFTAFFYFAVPVTIVLDMVIDPSTIAPRLVFATIMTAYYATLLLLSECLSINIQGKRLSLHFSQPILERLIKKSALNEKAKALTQKIEDAEKRLGGSVSYPSL